MIHDAMIMLSGMHTGRTTTVAVGRCELFYVISHTEANKRPKQLFFRTTGTAGTCTFQVVLQTVAGVEIPLISAAVNNSRVNTSFTIINDIQLPLNAVLLFDVVSVGTTKPTGLAFNFVIG